MGLHEDCSKGLLRRIRGLLGRVAQRDCSEGLHAEWCSVGASGVLNGSQWVSHAAYAGLRLGSQEVQVNAAMCWCAAFVGCVGACRSSRGAERVRILQFLCLRTAEHALRGSVCSVGQEWCAMTMAAWRGSHVLHVAGARIQASSAKLVWDIKACGAYGASAVRGRARGVAG